jgi:hypothetical protein
MSKISIITLTAKHSFHIYSLSFRLFHKQAPTKVVNKTETIKTFSLQSFDQVK